MLLALVLLLLPSPAYAQFVTYVSIAAENRIAVFSMDSNTGKLNHQSNIKTSGSPGALYISHDGRFVFASIRSMGRLASFRRSDNGDLKLIGEVPAGADPAFVATDRAGKFLLTAYYFAGKVTVHKINKDGSLGKKPLQSIPTKDKAHAIMADASNRFVFVPHTGPNAIFQFKLDATTGKLSANSPLVLSTPPNSGPRHLWFHPKNPNIVYFDNEQESSVTLYRMSKSGKLRPVQTLSTLPPGYKKSNSNAHLEMSPDGRFVYASNRGHDSIAGFQVDAKSGKMKSIGQFKTEPTPRSFNISPDGKFLVAAGQGSGKLAIFRIAKNGKLKRIGTQQAGKQAWWVEVTKR